MTGRLETFQVKILDVNEAPTGLSLSGTTIYESDGAGTGIGDLRVADPDAADSHTFEVLDGNDYFEIVGQTLRLLQLPPSSSQAIEIAVTDSWGLVYSERFTIALESSPTATEDTPSSTAPNDPSDPLDDGPGDGPGGFD